MKIKVNDIEYSLNVQKAIEAGALVCNKPHYFDELPIGTLFLFILDSKNKGIYVKTGTRQSNRIAGTGTLKQEIGTIVEKCEFRPNTSVSIFRNGEWESGIVE